MNKIGIVILCTNAYFPLGVRFVKRFSHFYKGERKVKFFLFSDKDPKDYFPEGIDYEYIHTTNKNWVEGTNLKFKSILSLENIENIEYIYYFDADTNVSQEFTEDWFLGEMVGGQHYADQSRMKEVKAYDRNPRSKAYVPHNTPLPQTYFYGAFWGGKTEKIKDFCKIMLEWQKADKTWGYEPGVNDESYSNCYFHYNPPTKIVKTNEFKFLISDKGGIGETRKVNLNVDKILNDLKLHKNDVIDIRHGAVVVSQKIQQ
jgi:hypothetical protein